MPERGELSPELPVETTEGRRATGSPGDRLIVAVAAVALVGGAFIVAGKGLADDADQATNTATQSAVSVSTPSARPTASPRVVTVESQPLPSAPRQGGPQFSGWIRTRVDLPIYPIPSLDATTTGVLKKGAFAYAEGIEPATMGASTDDGITWLRVGFQGDGFVTAVKGPTDLVDRYEAKQLPQSPYVAGVGSSPDRLIMYGERRADDGRWTGYVATSADGSDWRLVDMGPLRDYPLQGVAYGPAGWLALANVENDGVGRTWLFASADGLEWRVSGAIDLNFEGWPLSFFGGDAGYLISVQRSYGSSVVPEFLHSTDGVTWTGQRVTTNPPLVEGELRAQLVTVATSRGFYAYTQGDECCGSGPQRGGGFGGFSTEGRTWQWHELPEGGTNLRVGSWGEGLLGIDVSQVTGQPRVWAGTIDGSSVQWKQMQAATALLRTTGVSALASNGTEAIVFGWDRRSGEPVAFGTSPAGWHSVPLPRGAFGGFAPTTVTARDDGTFIAVGMRHNLFADNPVVWQGTLSGSWSAEERPALGYAGPPANLTSCPARPSNAIAFNLVPSQWAVFCFGRQPMTFRAWVAECQGCFGGDEGADMEPAWLLNPPDRIALSPVEGLSDIAMPVTPVESLIVQPEWTGHWVEVTGHYDDPASASCREVADPRTGAIQLPRQVTIDNCRQQFVVTAVRLVAGPGTR